MSGIIPGCPTFWILSRTFGGDPEDQNTMKNEDKNFEFILMLPKVS
jgi:hypothetical protein